MLWKHAMFRILGLSRFRILNISLFLVAAGGATIRFTLSALAGAVHKRQLPPRERNHSQLLQRHATPTRKAFGVYADAEARKHFSALVIHLLQRQLMQR
jgi:hypothetical protein